MGAQRKEQDQNTDRIDNQKNKSGEFRPGTGGPETGQDYNRSGKNENQRDNQQQGVRPEQDRERTIPMGGIKNR